MTTTSRPGPGRPRVPWLAAFALAAGIAWSQSPSEADLKAAYVYNFAKFVQWPAEALPAATTPLTICVAGRELPPAFEALQGKSAQGHEVRVRRAPRGDDVRECHALYVPEGAEAAAAEALRAARGAPVLTVGESEGFAASRGIVGFSPRDERLQFEINPEAAARAGLRVSAQLLRLAIIVRDERRVRP